VYRNFHRITDVNWVFSVASIDMLAVRRVIHIPLMPVRVFFTYVVRKNFGANNMPAIFRYDSLVLSGDNEKPESL